jgi:hypothetical protein
MDVLLEGRSSIDEQDRRPHQRVTARDERPESPDRRGVPAQQHAAPGSGTLSLKRLRPGRFLGVEPFFMSFLAGLEAQFSKLGSSLLIHIAE